MKIINAKIKEVLSNAVYIELNNGFKNLKLALEKTNITYNDIISKNFHSKVYALSRNCCRATPILLMEKGKDDVELEQLIDTVLPLIDKDLKQCFNISVE